MQGQTLKFLVDFCRSQRHPLINSQSSIDPGIVLLEHCLIVALCRDREVVLLWNSEELIHHCWELHHLDDYILVRVMVSEDLQHVPVQLNVFWTSWRSHGSFNELLVIIHTSMVYDGVRIHGGSLGSDVLLAELEPFIKGDDASGLEIHGVEHLLSGSVLLYLRLVQSGILRSVSIGSGHRCSGIDQLGEGSLADKTISVGVSIDEQLQERMIQLGMRVTLLIGDCSLDKPDEIFLGLVESVDWARHLKGH